MNGLMLSVETFVYLGFSYQKNVYSLTSFEILKILDIFNLFSFLPTYLVFYLRLLV